MVGDEHRGQAPFLLAETIERGDQRLASGQVQPDRRFVILNREFTVRQLNGQAETRPIPSPDELLALLAERFGLHFPAGTRFRTPALLPSA